MELTGIGERLRNARQALGLSLEDVEGATRIRRHHLEALELEAFDRIPGPVYVRGFLRVYATHLGLAADELLQLYRVPPAETIVPQDSPVEVRIASATGGSRLRRFLVGGGIVLALGLLILAFIFYGQLRQLVSTPPPVPSQGGGPLAASPSPGGAGGPGTTTSGRTPAPAGASAPAPQPPPKPPTTAAPAPQPPPKPATTAGATPPSPPAAPAPQAPPKPSAAAGLPPGPAGAAAPAPQPPPKPPAATGGPSQAPATPSAPNILAAPLHAVVTASARTWVRVVADGATVFEGFLLPGEQQAWEAAHQLTLRVGNAGAIEVTLNGHPVGRLGESGAVVDRAFTVGAPPGP